MMHEKSGLEGLEAKVGVLVRWDMHLQPGGFKPEDWTGLWTLPSKAGAGGLAGWGKGTGTRHGLEKPRAAASKPSRNTESPVSA
jgi:hypothetical protein